VVGVAVRLADTFCPECHGDFDLVALRRDRLVKRCRACGHKWNEEREAFRKGYVSQEGASR